MNNFNNFIITLFAICYFIGFTSSQISSFDECFTPARQRGQCVNIQQCPAIISILTNSPKPLSRITKNTLTALGCGFEGRIPKVCCDIQTATQNFDSINRPTDVMRSDPAQSPTYYSESPPPVEGHPNLRLLVQNCGLADEERILGGNKTRIFEFPWMALLSYVTISGQRFKCGGTIINNRYILTAAHCMINLGSDRLFGVRVGEHDITKQIDCDDEQPNTCAPPYQDLRIEQAIPHPNYSGIRFRASASKLQNDIGLLRLSSPIDTSQENAKAICLPYQQKYREAPLHNEELWVTGWGITEEGRSSPYMLKARLPYFPNDQCGRVMNVTIGDGIGFRQLCAGGMQGIDACGGDSGGPLQAKIFEQGYLRYTQYGIVSFGPRSCGRLGVPGVYTRVSHYMKWILDTIRP